MVGVPGKFKGCNTCRARRVKCDNERPFCRKCVDSGRECGGYERETVFIIGTVEDQGRCSSHPPRVVKSKKGKSSSRSAEPEGLDLVPNHPLRPAWDDLISVSSRGRSYHVQIAALHTNPNGVSKAPASDNGQDGPVKTVYVSFPPYQAPSNSSLDEGPEFQLSAQCLIHLAGAGDDQGAGTRPSTTDSVCMFIYQHNSPSVYYNNNQTSWKPSHSQTNTIKRMGPSAFQTFPNHHFFARVYRPSAIAYSLLNSMPTFLSSPEWLSTPFESHPKSSFDRLLDILTLLPPIFSRADRVLLPQDQTISRRLLAQDLLCSLIDIDLHLSQWFSGSLPNPAYWIVNPSFANLPFTEAYAFCDIQTGLAIMYYWATCVLLWPRCWRLWWTIFEEPVGHQHHHHMGLEMPARLQGFDAMRYAAKEVRGAASNVLRGLDWGLAGSVQPDLLGWVMQVVRVFYEGLGVQSSMDINMGMSTMGMGNMGIGMVEGQLELGWLEGFMGRMVQRGREVQEVVMARKWVEGDTF
ncbi:hypothetical protein QBC42DRAFT_107675 [Cladorrhinum samala]|uniref:Zn(2)-C6 fungal-type domain-containing protein n=1 Tax=Cladorrhinum samala TaxID=585594 RepID=A0AAV9HJT3_9PEZI|nr:hypothetical protein QBC42DRAFT_107675 [Cladorrhinum samala]